jgi:hypothetical protein
MLVLVFFFVDLFPVIVLFKFLWNLLPPRISLSSFISLFCFISFLFSLNHNLFCRQLKFVF